MNTEWLINCAAPTVAYCCGSFGIAGAIAIGIEKFQKNKRQIALWIGKHIYHEDWTPKKSNTIIDDDDYYGE